MKIAVVTTFNNKLYKEYAYKFIQTYFDHWPWDLHVYSEDQIHYNSIFTRTKERFFEYNTFEEVPNCKSFVERNKDKPHVPPKQFEKMWRQVKGFRHDGVRFSYKVYAYTDFILNKSENYDAVICIDADSWFFKEIGSGFIKEHISKPGCMMSYLGRGSTYHSEAGFLFFDLNHSHTKNYADQMKKMYDEDSIYKIPEQHDSYVWDYVREKFESKGVLTNDIGDGRTGHVQARSVLGKVYDHVKGRKPKKKGFSIENRKAVNELNKDK